MTWIRVLALCGLMAGCYLPGGRIRALAPQMTEREVFKSVGRPDKRDGARWIYEACDRGGVAGCNGPSTTYAIEFRDGRLVSITNLDEERRAARLARIAAMPCADRCEYFGLECVRDSALASADLASQRRAARGVSRGADMVSAAISGVAYVPAPESVADEMDRGQFSGAIDEADRAQCAMEQRLCLSECKQEANR